jgi:hypothetical protein
MKASELKAGTLYASSGPYSQPGILLSNEAIYGDSRNVFGGGMRVSAGKNYPVLTIRLWGTRLTTDQLKAAAAGYKPCKPGDTLDMSAIPEGTDLVFWSSRKFEGEYEAVMARNAAAMEAAEKALIDRDEKMRQVREDRQAATARLASLLPDAADLLETGTNLRVSISMADLKALLDLAEGAK